MVEKIVPPLTEVVTASPSLELESMDACRLQFITDEMFSDKDINGCQLAVFLVHVRGI